MIKRIPALLLALSLASPWAMAANSNQHPLKSVLPGAGSSVGVDLANECLSGSVLPIANGGTGSGTGVAATNGQVYIGDTGTTTFIPNTITGTSNQVTVTNGAHTITLSTPQNIGTASSPTFAGLTLSSPLTVANGGSGAATLTAHGVLTGQTTSALHASAAGTTGQAFISGGASADGAYGVTLPVGGGTGLATLTAHGVLVGEGTSNVAPTTAGTNGQVFLGSTGADPVFATLGSTGATITSTTGAGTLNLDVATDLIIHKTVNLSSANILAMYGTPVVVVAAPASGKNIVVHKAMLTMTTTSTQYANGGSVVFQIGNTNHAGGTATTATIANTVINAGAGTSYTTVIPVSYTGTAATGLYITNASGAFDTGTGTGVMDVWYSVQ